MQLLDITREDSDVYKYHVSNETLCLVPIYTLLTDDSKVYMNAVLEGSVGPFFLPFLGALLCGDKVFNANSQ